MAYPQLAVNSVFDLSFGLPLPRKGIEMAYPQLAVNSVFDLSFGLPLPRKGIETYSSSRRLDSALSSFGLPLPRKGVETSPGLFVGHHFARLSAYLY